MDNQDIKRSHGRILTGLFLLAIGSVLFLRQTGFPMPDWLFTWPALLIVAGLFIGLKHGFRGAAWIIMVVIGSMNLFDTIEPDYSFQQYTIPVLLLALGLFLILRPHRKNYRRWRNWDGDSASNDPRHNEHIRQELQPVQHRLTENDLNEMNYLDSVAVFGSVRKVIVSKDFKGGETVAVFGGNEIDLRQADINGNITLEVTQILGGTKILLPAHWDVKSEMVAFFGGIEDKRQLPPGASNPGKILILRGTSIFGGIEIRNF